MAAHIQSLISKSPDPTFDILCYEKELYYLFTFERMNEPHYLVGGPMLLSSIYQTAEMKTLSFSSTMNGRDLNLLVDNLPVVSLNSFSACLRIMLLLMRNSTLSYEEICSYKLSDLTDSFRNALIIDLFDHQEEYRAHTPYSHEIALLTCIKEGDLTMLESLYRTLPDIKYGNMSNHSNPVRQLFYGCISNTTLATRYAIEGGLDEETAFTLSDLYIKRMEACRTLYELHAVNEKMAMDFTRHVSEAKALIHPKYSAAIRKCIESITGNRQEKVSLVALAKEVNLTPHYLSFLFQKETGQTIRSFVEETRINKAKELLIYSQLSYSDISQSLFFSSQSYFISVFKRRVGLTPKKYRDLHSKSNR
ncbi:helix-turn-helix domain-containing protein [Gorillibacterium sp. CAU 1737]|uniref:helix-turn-helix transcriptional regulator n=1 Tax=Gorillibacterium sp. CAU 1737 TaxID=3140362 RepID=UPI0032604604